MTKNVLVAAPWPEAEEQRLRNAGHNVEVWDVPSTEVGNRTEELYERLAEGQADALIFTPHIKVNSEFRAVAPESLTILSSMSAGFDHIQRVPSEQERFSHIGYAPGVTDGAVAD